MSTLLTSGRHFSEPLLHSPLQSSPSHLSFSADSSQALQPIHTLLFGPSIFFPVVTTTAFVEAMDKRDDSGHDDRTSSYELKCPEDTGFVGRVERASLVTFFTAPTNEWRPLAQELSGPGPMLLWSKTGLRMVGPPPHRRS